jgi:hypothetical protein
MHIFEELAIEMMPPTEARRKPESQERICRRLGAMERNQQLTYATSIIHLAFAIASISILIHQRWLWAASLACLAAGVVLWLLLAPSISACGHVGDV